MQRFARPRSLPIAIAAGACLLPILAPAADSRAGPTSSASEQAPFTIWSGPHFGFTGSAGGAFSDFSFASTSNGNVGTSGFGEDRRDTSVLLGANLGYDWQFGRTVLGVEGDCEGVSLKREISAGPAPSAPPSSGSRLVRIHTDSTGSIRGRAGFAYNNFLVYATGGAILESDQIQIDAVSDHQTLFGYTVGGGFETRIARNVSAGIQYRFADFPHGVYNLNGTNATMSTKSHQVMARLNWYPSGLTIAGEERSPVDVFKLPGIDWNLHAQSTFIEQAIPDFHSPYVGTNSLTPRQARETWSTTAYIGVRLREGTELYFNPETDQGFGPSGTVGLAGFSNGEAAKAGFVYPTFRAQRYFVRQTFGFGGAQETVADSANQLAGTRDVNRLTITAGKVSITDLFDNNIYAHDPRSNFFNAATFTSAAYDYPANLAGYTNGITAEYNRKDWTFRTGVFQVPTVAGSDTLDSQPGRGGVVAELEGRYVLMSQSGTLRAGTFDNRTYSGDYGAALLSSDVNAGLVQSRRTRDKYGFYVNAEQALSDSLGIFARFSWNNGQTEIVSYTDVDASTTAGFSLKGSSWNRPSDVIGIAGAVNSLVPSHRQFLAAGGLGLLIGDGRLNYSDERILESYYAVSLTPATTVSLDYQMITNPAYNADRGPVSVFSTRLHAEF